MVPEGVQHFPGGGGGGGGVQLLTGGGVQMLISIETYKTSVGVQTPSPPSVSKHKLFECWVTISLFYCHRITFFKINIFKKFFQEH